jgi:VIT1/CCC1 family predicted Fe2+/Mn2+ transporter
LKTNLDSLSNDRVNGRWAEAHPTKEQHPSRIDNVRTKMDDRRLLNAEAGITTDGRRARIGRAVAAIVPLAAIALALLVPTLEALFWLTICCLAYLPIATLWICWGTENGSWKAIARSAASVVAMIACGVLGLAAHLIFHRAIHLEPLAMWAFAGAAAGLSASLYFPWVGDVSVSVVDFLLSSL